MQSRYRNSASRSPLSLLLSTLGRHLPLLLFLALSVAGLFGVHRLFSPTRGTAEAIVAASSSYNRSAAIFKTVPERPVKQRLPQSQAPIRIGLIVGHLGSDSGAVCADGLTELEVNQSIIDRVVVRLNDAGISSEVLAEFDDRLYGYSATALISVHADSCEYYNDLATGFKIAGSSLTDSNTLEQCVEQAYATVTKLPYHANTITPHMTDYHAFRLVAPGMPAIIIETGFLNRDRDLLTTEIDVPAAGIANGIICFLEAR